MTVGDSTTYPRKLRLLADELDRVDRERGVTDQHEVQDDLRAIADLLDPGEGALTELASRIDSYTRGTPKMDGSEEVFLPKYGDRPGQVPATLPGVVVWDLRAAAQFLVGLEAENARLSRVCCEHGDTCDH